MIKLLANYATLVFDCDGVILNSNQIKTEAFRKAALPWGAQAANELVKHHRANGGISRHRKFVHFLDSIVPQFQPLAVPGSDGPGLDELLSRYAQAVRGALMTCPVADGLETLRSQTSHASWCIVSGGHQEELREVFSARGIDHLFDAGIFGSPDCKDIILARELANGTISAPALYLGDSRYDFEAAERGGLAFIFVTSWSEAEEHQDFIESNALSHIRSLSDLVQS